jgi:hypothetical protein
VQDLERHAPAEIGIEGGIDHPHGARSQRIEDEITPDGISPAGAAGGSRFVYASGARPGGRERRVVWASHRDGSALMRAPSYHG